MIPSTRAPSERGDRSRRVIATPLAALGGVVAATVGLAAAEIVAGLGRSLRSPVLDVGDRVIDRVPVWLKELAIDLFGTADKTALLVGIGLALVTYAAVVGSAALRWGPKLGDAGILLFVALGVVSSLGARTGRRRSTVMSSPSPLVTAE